MFPENSQLMDDLEAPWQFRLIKLTTPISTGHFQIAAGLLFLLGRPDGAQVIK